MDQMDYDVIIIGGGQTSVALANVGQRIKSVGEQRRALCIELAAAS